MTTLCKVGKTDTWINPEAITAVWPWQIADERRAAITAVTFVGGDEALRIHGASVDEVLNAVARSNDQEADSAPQ